MISYELSKKIHKKIVIGHRTLQRAIFRANVKLNTNELGKRENIEEVFDIENEDYKNNDNTVYVFMDKRGWLELFLGNKSFSNITAKRGKNMRKYIVEYDICRVFKTIKNVDSFLEPRRSYVKSDYIRFSCVHRNKFEYKISNGDTAEKRNKIYLKYSQYKRERRENERVQTERDMKYELYNRLEKYKQNKIKNVSDENIRLKMSAFFSLYANCIAQNDYTIIRDNFGKYMSSFDDELDLCRRTIKRFDEYIKYPNDLRNKVRLIEMLQVEH